MYSGLTRVQHANGQEALKRMAGPKVSLRNAGGAPGG